MRDPWLQGQDETDAAFAKGYATGAALAYHHKIRAEFRDVSESELQMMVEWYRSICELCFTDGVKYARRGGP